MDTVAPVANTTAPAQSCVSVTGSPAASPVTQSNADSACGDHSNETKAAEKAAALEAEQKAKEAAAAAKVVLKILNPVVHEEAKALLSQLPLLREFHLPTERLSQIAQAMISDLGRGLQRDYTDPAVAAADPQPKPLLMLPSYVERLPTGKESGVYLAIDIGGTNLRVCAITLFKERNCMQITSPEELEEKTEQLAREHARNPECPVHLTTDHPYHRCRQAHYRIPDNIKRGTLRAFCDFVATRVADFLRRHNHAWAAMNPTEEKSTHIAPLIDADNIHDSFIYGPPPTSMGFTFSFPVKQTSLKESSLIQWTKGFSIPDAVGCDIAAEIQKSMDAYKIGVTVHALINDTVGTLLAHAYDNPATAVGVILGTGTNAAYVESCDAITKLQGSSRTSGGHMIINTEWGAFDNARQHLPLLPYDLALDEASLNPGFQMFEKMISGMYLGEVLRQLFVALASDSSIRLFGGSEALVGTKIMQHNGVPTKLMPRVEEANGLHALKAFTELLSFELRTCDVPIVLAAVRAVRTRAARLSASAIGALLMRMGKPVGTEDVAVAIDGTLWLKYPEFKQALIDGLADVIGQEKARYVQLQDARDGSGMGAAIVAALYATH